MIKELDDFGFSFATDEELKEYEKQLINSLESSNIKHEHSIEEYEKKLNKIRGMIFPLIKNLMKDPEKNYIYWPNRVERLQKFNDELEKVFND